ncbi:MAG: LacI family transcriptional regulator [Chloroflexota bacterium]|nr:LacI family transcriptional regulator [Chloroflexota bacterium]
MSAVAKAVTIQDVAALAGVSTSTVSNLLNGRVSRMSAATRERIELAMGQLGYQANQAARQLKTGQSPIIGLVIPSVANPFWGAFVQAVEEAAMERGYQVLLGNGGRDPRREQRYAESLWSHGVRGVIFGSSPLSLDYIHRLVERGLHVMVFDRRLQGGDSVMDGISVDNAAGGYMATRHLLDLGHLRIGFLSGPLKTSSRLERLEGYRNALIDAGIKHDPSLIWAGESPTGAGDVEGADIGRTGARALLSSEEPPTGLITINDMYALGAYAGANDLGFRIPEDVSIVGFDDITMAAMLNPPLTTVKQPISEMMRSAVSTLIERLEGSRSGPAHIVTVPTEIIARKSAAAPRSTPFSRG